MDEDRWDSNARSYDARRNIKAKDKNLDILSTAGKVRGNPGSEEKKYMSANNKSMAQLQERVL